MTFSHNTIYFVGKAYHSRSLLLKVQQLGYGLGVFHDKNLKLHNDDLFDSIVPIDFSNPDKLIAQLEASGSISAVGLICTYERYVKAAAIISNALSLRGNSIRSSELCTDKLLMREAFMQADPSITPRFARVTSETELLAYADTAPYPLYLKPASLVKSLLIARCVDRNDLLHNYRYIRDHITETYQKYHVYDHEPHILVEEAIVGKGCSVAAFIDEQGVPHFCPGIVQITTAQEQGISDNYLYKRVLPATLDPVLESRILAVAAIGITALGMRSTPAHVELIYDTSNNVKIVEIGARIGGYRPRMYELCYGIDMIEQEIALATGSTLHLEGSQQALTGVFELFPTSTGSFKGISNATDTQEFTYFAPKAKPGQVVGPAKYGYKAAGIIIASAAEPTFNKLTARVDTMQVEVDA